MDLWSLLRGRAKSVHRKIKNKSKKRVPINARAQKTGDNVPLELTIILSAWIAALQRRKSIDVRRIQLCVTFELLNTLFCRFLPSTLSSRPSSRSRTR